MANSNVNWKEFRDAYGNAQELGEMLEQILRGEDVWGDLFNRVLHQGTVYEATVPVASWIIQALETGKLGDRLIPVGKPFGTDEEISEKALAFELLSSMAESAECAITEPDIYCVSSGGTQKDYESIGARLLDALKAGIPVYERGLSDPDEDVREASEELLKANAGKK